MYEPFFGMERRPFSATPDPGCFFSSSELQAVLDDLTVCVERGQGIGILTAAAGIGKTLLCQRLAADLRARDESSSQFECVYLSNSNFPTRRSLLQAILFEMGDEYSRRDEPELRIDLRSRLLSLQPQREALVLIVDEAHLFSDELLEELRTLSDLANEGSSLVRIVLSGQHELEERLTDRSFDALNQRISKHVFAEPLTISESVEYIEHRLGWAGSDIESVFSEQAIGIITRASGGVPRCLNQLSDHSLLLAFASDQKPVSEDTVREALEDLKQLPLHWNDVSDGTEIVGYVEDEDEDEDEDEESAENFEGESDDSAIDADLEAALSQLADSGSVERGDEESAEPVSENETTEAADEAEIVESLRAAFDIAPPETEPAPAMADGFEFDFSDSSDAEIDGSDDGVAASSEHEAAPEHVAATSDAEPEDVDETLFQMVPSTPQETMLEVRANNGSKDGSNDTVDDNAEDDGAGMSFQITSDGFELDDFGPPEEMDTPAAEVPSVHHKQGDHEQADSGVIEFSFNAEDSTEDADASNVDDSGEELDSDVSSAEFEEPGVVENSESADQEGSTKEHTVSAAEITLALFGQDSVLPEHKCDTVMSEPADETEVEKPVIAEPSADEHADADSEVTTSEDVCAAEAGELECETLIEEEPEVMSGVTNDESGYEEELVYDPYAALQEPDGAGIVWDVAGSSRHVENAEVSESSEGGDTSAEAVIEEPVEQIERSDLVEVTDQAIEEAAVEESSDAELVEESTAEALLEEATFEDAEFEEAVDGPVEAEGQSEQFSSEESQQDIGFVQQEHDSVQPVEESPLQPDRLVDAVLPLLEELDDDLDSIARPSMTGRSVLDIEAELIQTIEHGSDELEDEIGAMMLDICLDTQSALQDSAAAIRNAEAAELESLNDFDEATDEPTGEPFDIVQPEPPNQDESASYNLDLRFVEPSDVAPREDATPPPPAQDEQVDKPFGRLFSDLRRRKA